MDLGASEQPSKEPSRGVGEGGLGCHRTTQIVGLDMLSVSVCQAKEHIFQLLKLKYASKKLKYESYFSIF